MEIDPQTLSPKSSNRALFDQMLDQWLRIRYGDWVWIHGEKVRFFPSYQRALTAAKAAGLKPEEAFIEEVVSP
jgi:hypothetical protein